MMYPFFDLSRSHELESASSRTQPSKPGRNSVLYGLRYSSAFSLQPMLLVESATCPCPSQHCTMSGVARLAELAVPRLALEHGRHQVGVRLRLVEQARGLLALRGVEVSKPVAGREIFAT